MFMTLVCEPPTTLPKTTMRIAMAQRSLSWWHSGVGPPRQAASCQPAMPKSGTARRSTTLGSTGLSLRKEKAYRARIVLTAFAPPPG